jgi:hypothetical protein
MTPQTIHEYLVCDLLQVRGTPGCGKTTLAWLLHQHIEKNEPGTQVIHFDVWPEDNPFKHWSDCLTARGWKQQDGSIIILDKGQTTYCASPSGLWVFFKSVADDHTVYQNRIIVFTSYGSPTGPIPMIPTSMFIPPAKRVTLCPVHHNDGIAPAGLFLTSTEFNDLISRRYPPKHYQFDSTFFSWIFQLTAGHVGGILDLISLITSRDVSQFFFLTGIG